jgi:hypothetical protein
VGFQTRNHLAYPSIWKKKVRGSLGGNGYIPQGANTDSEGPQAMLPILLQHGYLLRRLRFLVRGLISVFVRAIQYIVYLVAYHSIKFTKMMLQCNVKPNKNVFAY